MELNNLRAVDHARAAAVAVAIATNDDAMAVFTIEEAGDDPHPESVRGLILACSLNLVQMLEATMGAEKALELMRATLVNARAVVESEAS